MQYYKISPDTSFSDISNLVGSKNIQDILAANNLSRSPKLGANILAMQAAIKSDPNIKVSGQTKLAILNKNVGSSDIFEALANLDDDEWKVASVLDTIPGYLKVPDSVKISSMASSLGNSKVVSSATYNAVVSGIAKGASSIDPNAFLEYTPIRESSGTTFVDSNTFKKPTVDIFQGFKIPWGKIILHSSLDDQVVEFPCYPESVSDGRSANYSTMPDLLYQYEPWQVYQSSGPRTNSYSFHFHRDMWTGDHRDGMANKLIRFCESCCYADYNGSAVNTTVVSLIVEGDILIRGVMTDVKTSWEGPIGLDGWYLECTLDITITEVSEKPLNFKSIRQKSLIG